MSKTLSELLDELITQVAKRELVRQWLSDFSERKYRYHESDEEKGEQRKRLQLDNSESE